MVTAAYSPHLPQILRVGVYTGIRHTTRSHYTAKLELDREIVPSITFLCGSLVQSEPKLVPILRGEEIFNGHNGGEGSD